MGVYNLPDKEPLINDLKALLAKHDTVTRDLYRVKGAFPERIWNKFYPTFKDFKKAASGQDALEYAPIENSQFENISISGNKCNVNLDGTTVHTLQGLIEYVQVDMDIWEVDEFTANKRDSSSKDVRELWQIKATFSKKKNIAAAKEEIEALKRQAKESAHWPKPVLRYESKYSGNSLELLIPDLHAGKFAWGKETGHPDYDTPTAISTYEAAVDDILSMSEGYVFDEILLGVGNDLLNSDDYNSQTTKGTLVSSDTRYQKTYKAIREMLCRTVEKLRPYCKRVVVKFIPGNHDAQGTFTLGDSLECYFHNYEDVVIDNEPTPHKFYRWGKVLLGLTHGDKGKKADYGIWMATERPVDFGETKFREIHIGHTHGLKVDEKFGIRVRTFAALCPPDAWHSSEHFVGNLRQAEAIVWNKEKGRIAEFIHTASD